MFLFRMPLVKVQLIAITVLLALLLGACSSAEKKAKEKAELQQHFLEAILTGATQNVSTDIEAGADVNAPHFGLGGLTPLMFAAGTHDDTAILKLLLAAKADPNTDTATGDTALMFAASHTNNPEVIKLLLAAGADVNAINISGQNALYLAVNGNFTRSIAETLLQAGADGSQEEENFNVTAFDLARRYSELRNSPVFMAHDPMLLAEKKEKSRVENKTETQEQVAEDEHNEDEEEGDYGGEEPDAEVDENNPNLISKDLRAMKALNDNPDVDLWQYNIGNKDNILPNLDAPSSFVISSRLEMPVLDGALASYPLYSSFAKACYKELAPKMIVDSRGTATPIPLTNGVVNYYNTATAFSELMTRGNDIVFGMEPSEKQKNTLPALKREIRYTPLGREAFVFFIHKDNPVQSLSTEQIKGIYSGAIANWKEVGGADLPILAFQRNEGSGSQSTLLRFMGKTPVKPALVEIKETMSGIITDTAGYRDVPNSIGFSFYFFATSLASRADVKLLAVNGIAPSKEHIEDKSYPILVTRYAMSLKDNSKPAVLNFLAWMQGPQGQELVRKLGYVGN